MGSSNMLIWTMVILIFVIFSHGTLMTGHNSFQVTPLRDPWINFELMMAVYHVQEQAMEIEALEAILMDEIQGLHHKEYST